MNIGDREDINRFKKEARSLTDIGPLHYMILKLEETVDYEERINIIRNVESMIRLPRPLIQLFIMKMGTHVLLSKIILGESNSQTQRTQQLSFL